MNFRNRSIGGVLLLAISLVMSCSKDAIDLTDANPGLDPATEPNGVVRVLQVNGEFRDEEPRPSDTIMGRNFYLIPYQDTTYAYEGTPVTPKFTFKAPGFALSHYLVQMPPATGYWYIKPPAPTGFTMTIPSLVKTGNLKMAISARLVKIAGGIVVDSFITEPVDHVVRLLVPNNCSMDLSGRNKQGLFYRKLNLGENPGKLKISFLSMDSSAGNKTSDRFDLRYNNTYVLSSSSVPVGSAYVPSCGGLAAGAQKRQGWKEYTYDYNPKYGQMAELFIQSNCTDTTEGVSWQFKMQCPE